MLMIAIAFGGWLGCGDETTKERTTQAATTVSTDPISKARYLAKTNLYCRKSWTDIVARYEKFKGERKPGTSDEDFFAEAAQAFILPGFQFQFDAMRMFGVPAGDEDQVEELVGTMQLKIEHGQKNRITSPQQLAALFAPYNNLAHRYGFRECILREAFFGAVHPRDLFVQSYKH